MQIDIKLLERIIKSLPNYIFVKDFNLIYKLCNHNFVLAVGGNSPVGKNDYELPWDKSSAKLYQEEDRYVLNTGKPILDKEVSMLLSDEEKFLSVSKVPLYDEKHHIVGVLGIYIDITEKKKAKQALISAKEAAEAASKAKTEFLENMRHDIRTPLSGIVGCAQLIQSQASNAAKIAEFATDLVESSDALLEFLNKVLESIKVASGEIPLLKKKFSLHKVLEQLINLNKSYAVSKKLELNLVYDESIPTYVIGDPIRIQRIILELITNALKFTEKGQVKVVGRLMKEKTKAGQVLVKLSVSDTGMGIPLDKQNEVYTRFKRLTPSYQGIYSGTGLGLSVVKQFMDDLDGELSLKSQANQGSTFTCLIPLQESLLMDSEDVEEILPIENKWSKKKQLSVNELPEELSNDSGGCVLVVEDNAIAARVAQGVLLNLNCQIDIALDGKTALTYIEKNHYDLILMDIGLPDNDGGEVTRRIRLKQWQQNPSVSIIGLTAHISDEKKRQCLQNGMNAIYTKPLTTTKVSEILNAFLSHSHSSSFNEEKHEPSPNNIESLPVLDKERALKLLGNEELVHQMWVLLKSELTKELSDLKQYQQVNDWSAIRGLAHKWRGGTSYCGAVRLEHVCQLLETSLQTEVPLKESEPCYQTLLQVAEATIKAIKP